MTNQRYISVRNWRKFQHYDPEKRIPPWIKNHTELMSSAAYLGLTSGQRGVLHGIWLEYARSRCELPESTLTLTRRLSVKVSRHTLDALNHAGFIDFVASKTLADGYQAASTSRARVEEEAEEEKENPLPTETGSKTTSVNGNGPEDLYEPEHPDNPAPDIDLDRVLRTMPE